MKNTTEEEKKQAKYFFTLVLLLCLSRPVFSQVDILGDWRVGTSHTKETGSNRILLFFAHGESASVMDVNSVTYGGQAMEKIVDYIYEGGGYAYPAAFILDETGISAASSSTFSPTWGGTTPNTRAV